MDQISIKPSIHIGGRCANFLNPVPEFERKRNTEARNTGAFICIKCRSKLIDAVESKLANFIGNGPGICDVAALPNVTEKIHQDDLCTAPSNLEAK